MIPSRTLSSCLVVFSSTALAVYLYNFLPQIRATYVSLISSSNCATDCAFLIKFRVCCSCSEAPKLGFDQVGPSSFSSFPNLKSLAFPNITQCKFNLVFLCLSLSSSLTYFKGQFSPKTVFAPLVGYPAVTPSCSPLVISPIFLSSAA